MALAVTVGLFTKFNAMTLASLAVGVFLLTFVGTFILGWIVELIATTLGGKGKFYEGLTSVVNAFVVPSIGVLIAAIFIHIMPVGIGVIFIALAVTIALGLATLYRSIKDLFSVDMITAFVTVSILTMALILAVLGATIGMTKFITTLGIMV
jgi:hypothetical protein